MAYKISALRAERVTAGAVTPVRSYTVGSLTKADRKPMIVFVYDRAVLPLNDGNEKLEPES